MSDLLARVTATTTLAERHADIGSRSRDGDKDAGGGTRGRRLSLSHVTATATLAEARACSIDGNDGLERTLFCNSVGGGWAYQAQMGL